jgi:hypothetical protein
MENEKISLNDSKLQLITEIDRRVEEKIIEASNADLLKKLIRNAESLTRFFFFAKI